MLKLDKRGMFPASILLYAYLTLFIIFILVVFGVVFLGGSLITGGPGGSLSTGDNVIITDYDLLQSYLDFEFKCNNEIYKVSDYIIASSNNICPTFPQVTDEFFSKNYNFLKNGPEKHFQVFIDETQIYGKIITSKNIEEQSLNLINNNGDIVSLKIKVCDFNVENIDRSKI